MYFKNINIAVGCDFATYQQGSVHCFMNSVLILPSYVFVKFCLFVFGYSFINRPIITLIQGTDTENLNTVLFSVVLCGLK